MEIPAESTRETLLNAYRHILGMIGTATKDAAAADQVAVLAKAASRLVSGSFAYRLVFGTEPPAGDGDSDD